MHAVALSPSFLRLKQRHASPVLENGHWYISSFLRCSLTMLPPLQTQETCLSTSHCLEWVEAAVGHQKHFSSQYLFGSEVLNKWSKVVCYIYPGLINTWVEMSCFLYYQCLHPSCIDPCQKKGEEDKFFFSFKRKHMTGCIVFRRFNLGTITCSRAFQTSENVCF